MTLLVAVAAVVLAVMGWFRPASGSASASASGSVSGQESSYSEQEAADARVRICEVTGKVRRATNINTNLENPVPEDQIGELAVAANARLALSEGGAYLLRHLAAEPATPADLNRTVTAMADTMQELSINYLAGASADSPEQQPLREGLSTQVAELDQLCQ